MFFIIVADCFCFCFFIRCTYSTVCYSQALLRGGGEAIADKRSTFLFLILDFVPNYVWITHRADIRWNCLKPDQIINRFPSVPFTTKTGLNRILGESKLAKTNYPRCYEVTRQH